MAKKEDPANTAVALARQVGGPLALPDAPDFMQADAGVGLKQIASKVRPPFLKIVQKQSSDELINEFGIGTMITTPDRVAVTDAENPVRVVVVYMFTEYLKLSGIALKGQEPMIADRSIDPSSKLAQMCENRATWYEDHPKYPGEKDYAYRNCTALNFLLMFQEEHLQFGLPVALSFSRGSYGRGQSFCNLISMRKNKPPFGCVFQLSVDPVVASNSKGEWRRPLIENPPERPWVESREEYDAYKAMHSNFEELYRANQLVVDPDDDDAFSEGAAAAQAETGVY